MPKKNEDTYQDGSYHAVDVVVVTGEDGKPLRVNKSDYDSDPDGYTLFNGGETSKPAEGGTQTKPLTKAQLAAQERAAEKENERLRKEAEAAAALAAGNNPPTLNVSKEGDRFFVTDPDGHKIERSGLDSTTGYASEAEAWTAAYPS